MFTDDQVAAIRKLIADENKPLLDQLKSLDENVAGMQIGRPGGDSNGGGEKPAGRVDARGREWGDVSAATAYLQKNAPNILKFNNERILRAVSLAESDGERQAILDDYIAEVDRMGFKKPDLGASPQAEGAHPTDVSGVEERVQLAKEAAEAYRPARL